LELLQDGKGLQKEHLGITGKRLFTRMPSCSSTNNGNAQSKQIHLTTKSKTRQMEMDF